MMDIANMHRHTLIRFVVSDCYLSLKNIQWMSSEFLSLESLECSLTSPNVVGSSCLQACATTKNVGHLGFHPGGSE